jgi:hypothetical protein
MKKERSTVNPKVVLKSAVFDEEEWVYAHLELAKAAFDGLKARIKKFAANDGIERTLLLIADGLTESYCTSEDVPGLGLRSV